MSKRQRKKVNKNEWQPLIVRVVLKNGKIRNRTYKLGGYSHYTKIIYPTTNKDRLRIDLALAESLSLYAGHWRDIKDYNSRNQILQLGYKPLYEEW